MKYSPGSDHQDLSPRSSLESLPQTPHRLRSKGGHCDRSRQPTIVVRDDFSLSESSGEDSDYRTDITTPVSSEFPRDYRASDEFEDSRNREYPQLKGKVYLDHAGTTLYARSLIEDFSADLISNLYGNPHSASAPSLRAGQRIDAIRDKALRFFNADPEHWDLVFTANATAAIKLLIECFSDHAASTNTPVWYGYHKDSHTSIVGVREMTKMHRCFTSDQEVDVWINSGRLGEPRARQLGLFAYPGQSNMTGRRLPLSWPGRIRKQSHKADTYTLLDAAALASTSALDLGNPATAPDFVALSFYKIFGFPNIGALLVRKRSQHVLENRRYFGGGTVDMIVTLHGSWHAPKETSLHDRLEDGTLPFHSIFALDHAMNVHERVCGPDSMKFISHHTAQLSEQLYDVLSHLRHGNELPVAIIYKDDSAVYGDPDVQGATLVFNIRRPDGSMIGYEDVEQTADGRGIFLRSGSLCNPGGMASYLDWTPAEMKAAYAAGHRCSAPTQVMLGKPTGVVRVSLGAMSTAGDVLAFLDFIADEYLDTSTATPQPIAQGSFPDVGLSARRANNGSAIDATKELSLTLHDHTLRSSTPSITLNGHKQPSRTDTLAYSQPSSELAKPARNDSPMSNTPRPDALRDMQSGMSKAHNATSSQYTHGSKPSRRRFGRAMAIILHRKRS